jgi:hypothetical protein
MSGTSLGTRGSNSLLLVMGLPCPAVAHECNINVLRTTKPPSKPQLQPCDWRGVQLQHDSVQCCSLKQSHPDHTPTPQPGVILVARIFGNRHPLTAATTVWKAKKERRAHSQHPQLPSKSPRPAYLHHCKEAGHLLLPAAHTSIVCRAACPTLLLLLLLLLLLRARTLTIRAASLQCTKHRYQ